MGKYTDEELKSMAQITLNARKREPSQYMFLIQSISFYTGIHIDEVLVKIKEYIK